jgi:hypothetical protein
MDNQSYQDGLANRPMAPGTDQNSYKAGQTERESASAYNPGSSSGNQAAKNGFDWGPKVSVDGAAFTLFLTSPLLFTIYPVWGHSLYAPYALAFWLSTISHLPTGGALLIGIVGWIAMFFFGMRLETAVSQWAIYRTLRAVGRWAAAFLLVIWFATSNGSHEDMAHLVNRASVKALFCGLLAAILAHFVFRRGDRIYFPVEREVRKRNALAGKGEALKRPWIKRFFYSLLWNIPVVLACKLTVRMIVELFVDNPKVTFYPQYGSFVYMSAVAIWLILCFTGLLPGTGKIKVSAAALKAAANDT